jgi:hypothetical protein
MIDEDVHQRVKSPKLRELFAAYRADVPGGFRADVPGGFRADVPGGFRDGRAATPTARKTKKKTVTKKTPKKAPAGARKQAARVGASRKERVGAR